MTDGTTSAASHETSRRSRGEIDATGEAALGFLMGDHVDVDLFRVLDHRCADSLVEDPGPPRPPRSADHELRRVHLAGEVQQCGGHVVADNRVHRRTQTGGEFTDLAHLRCGDTGQPVAAHHVHDHQLGAGLRRDPEGAPHQRLRFGTTGDSHYYPLAGLPGGGDLVIFAVFVQRRVDLVGEPQQREFT